MKPAVQDYISCLQFGSVRMRNPQKGKGGGPKSRDMRLRSAVSRMLRLGKLKRPPPKMVAYIGNYMDKYPNDVIWGVEMITRYSWTSTNSRPSMAYYLRSRWF